MEGLPQSQALHGVSFLETKEGPAAPSWVTAQQWWGPQGPPSPTPGHAGRCGRPWRAVRPKGPSPATHSPRIPPRHQDPRSPVAGDDWPPATHWKCRSSPSLVPFHHSCSRKGRALCTEQETSRGRCRWPWILGGMLTTGAPGGKDLPSGALPGPSPHRAPQGAGRQGPNPRPHRPGATTRRWLHLSTFSPLYSGVKSRCRPPRAVVRSGREVACGRHLALSLK